MRASLKVLLVDDEEGIRGMLQTWLESEGAQVLPAGDADEAIRVWEKSEEPIQFLLTDVMMPGSMDGITLAEALNEKASDLKVLVISAFLGGRTDVDFSDKPNWQFRSKPFTLQQIKETTEQLLGPLSEFNG